MCFLSCVWDSHSGMEALCRLFPISRDWKAELKNPSPGPLLRENIQDATSDLQPVMTDWLSHTDAPFVQHNKVDCKYCDVEQERKHDESRNSSHKVFGNFHLGQQHVVKTCSTALWKYSNLKSQCAIYQRKAQVSQKPPEVPDCVQSHQQGDKKANKLYTQRPREAHTRKY